MAWDDAAPTAEQLAMPVPGEQAPPPAPAEPLGHKVIREGLPILGQIGGALGAGALATPETGGLGTVPAAMAGSAAGYAAGSEAAGWANHAIYGDDAPTYNNLDDAKRVALNAGTGAAAELGGQVLGKGLGMVAKSKYIAPFLDDAGQLVVNGFNKAGQYVGDKAENLAVAATGATRAQAEKFAPGTGRALLDNGIVKFGRSQSGIADAAQDAVGDAGDTISGILDDLTKKGAVGNKSDLVSGLQSKIDELSEGGGIDPAQADVVKQLENIKANVAAGPDLPSLNQVEGTKRGFQSMVNYANPEGNAAKAAAADVYKNSAENIVENSSAGGSDVADQFKAAKKLYGQLSPAADAGQARALQVAQSPIGGLGDASAYMAMGPQGVIAKKIIAPRINSSMASTANALSSALKATPEAFGKWAAPLSAAAARGEMSLNAADYVLQQTDQGYRQKRQQMNSNPTQQDQGE